MSEQITTPEARDSHDPRWTYDRLSTESARRAWPCATCGVRRDEHADQPEQSGSPSLDITDHTYVEARDVTPSAEDREALDLLDEMNAGGRIAYGDYSRLHDLIAACQPAPSAEDREAVIEEAFEQIGRDEPMSYVTRSDIARWVDLLGPLLAARQPAPVDTVRCVQCEARLTAEQVDQVTSVLHAAARLVAVSGMTAPDAIHQAARVIEASAQPAPVDAGTTTEWGVRWGGGREQWGFTEQQARDEAESSRVPLLAREVGPSREVSRG